MSYRATPNTTTGYSRFYLCGLEIALPSTDNFKARLPKENTGEDQCLENLKSNLRLAYKLADKANRKSHQNNKRLYDRKAKPRELEIQDLVYLYNPALKPHFTRKFAKLWSGPCQVTNKISELKLEITDLCGKPLAVDVNRHRKAYSSELWKFKLKQKPNKNEPLKLTKPRKMNVKC